MKRVNKFLYVFIIFAIGIFVCSFGSLERTYTFHYGENHEVIVEGINLDKEKAEAIADYIVYGQYLSDNDITDDNTKASVWCTLFGHLLETYTALETIHNVYTTSPKCVENVYSVEYCTRSSCDYIVKTLLQSHRISICHG